MAGHLPHYIARLLDHSIIRYLSSIVLNQIFVDFIGPISFGNHSTIVLLILLNFNLKVLRLCTFVLLSFLPRIRFCFFIENSSSLFIFCIKYDDANLSLILSFAIPPTYQKDAWQMHDSLFLFFQFLFF
jgi:hypothetical protein